MTTKRPELRLDPSAASALVPLWLEAESTYANKKYQDNDPQLPSLRGSLLEPTTASYQEFSNYFGRFASSYRVGNLTGDEHLLLKASQAIGKFTGAGRALLRVVLETTSGVTREEADQLTFVFAEEAIPTINQAFTVDDPALENYFVQAIDPRIKHIGDTVQDGDLAKARELAGELLVTQAQLFVDFTSETGIMAQPGLDSSDIHSELDHWQIPGTLTRAVVD